MNLKELKENWEDLGEKDAYWAVLTDPSKINNKWDEKAFYRSGKDRISHLFRSFHLEQQLSQRKKALDFGCGPGRLTQALCDQFDQVYGVDISSSMIRLAKEHNPFPNACEYFVNDVQDLSMFPSDHFDFVLSLITLQHIEKQFTMSYLKEFARVTKEGGIILFNLPTTPPLLLKFLITVIGSKGLNVLRQVYYRKKSVIEMHWIAENEILKWVQDSKLEVVTIKKDESVGKQWASNYYVLKKPAATD